MSEIPNPGLRDSEVDMIAAAMEAVNALRALGCDDIPKRLEQAVMLESVNAKPTQVAEFVHALASGAISDGFMRRMRHNGIRDMTTRAGADHENP